jgi:hypothetical protein
MTESVHKLEIYCYALSLEPFISRWLSFHDSEHEDATAWHTTYFGLMGTVVSEESAASLPYFFFLTNFDTEDSPKRWQPPFRQHSDT